METSARNNAYLILMFWPPKNSDLTPLDSGVNITAAIVLPVLMDYL
jgi:hypothetical protein